MGLLTLRLGIVRRALKAYVESYEKRPNLVALVKIKLLWRLSFQETKEFQRSESDEKLWLLRRKLGSKLGRVRKGLISRAIKVDDSTFRVVVKHISELGCPVIRSTRETSACVFHNHWRFYN